MDEKSAGDVLSELKAALRAAGTECGPVNGSDGSVFATMAIRLPNGQVFKIQAEETY